MRIKLTQLLFKPLSHFGISRSLQATALWSMLESFASPLFSLLLIPILTHNIGLEKYGLYVMIFAFVNFFSFTGLGMNTSITYYLAVNQHTKNATNISGRLGTALSLTLIGTVTFSLLFILTLTLFKEMLGVVYPQLVQHLFLVYAALLILILTQCDMVISAALKGLQQFKVSSKIEFMIRAIWFLVVMLVTVLIKEVGAIVFSIVIIVLMGLILRFRALRNVIELKVSNLKIHKIYINEFFHFGKWMTLQNIAGSMYGSLDKIIMGSLFGSKVVGIYNVILSITQLIHFVPANMLTFIMPKIANDKVTFTLATFKKIFAITIISAGLIAIVICTLKQFIFYKFSIDSVYSPLFYGLIISFILMSLNIPSYYVALGLNLIKHVSIQCVLGAMAGILSLLLLASKYGIFAVLASKLIYSLIAIFLLIPVLNKMRLVNQ